MAADYSKYSRAQLQQEYDRLIKIHSQDLANYHIFVKYMKQYFAGKQMPYSKFIQYFASGYLYTINQNYTINNYTYRHDPHVDSFSDLGELCNFIYTPDNNTNTNVDCLHFATIYAFADYNRDTLKTLVLLGTFLAIDRKDDNQLTAKERRMRAFDADFKNYNIDFNLRGNINYKALKKDYKELIYAVFKIHIVDED
ncbi:hypothetical protein [Psittacicella melopsittaci]|nr:hypothetical protein [Psittacicella melopsittaci]